MAGQSVILKPGEILFRKDDLPDGMYVIKQGQLEVFLNIDGKELSIATVGPGEIVGEMGLFDLKPRSASVRAMDKDVEVTKIRQSDFQNITKQFPRWFMNLLTTLSSRLRASNERIEKLQNRLDGLDSKILRIQRILTAIESLWYREGEKIGNDWHLSLEAMRKIVTLHFGEESKTFDRCIAVLIKEKFYRRDINKFSEPVLVTNSRGHLTRLLSVLVHFSNGRSCLPLSSAATEILQAFAQQVESSAYESVQIPLSELANQALKQGSSNALSWGEALEDLQRVGDQLQITGKGTEAILRSRKRDIKEVAACHQLVALLSREIG